MLNPMKITEDDRRKYESLNMKSVLDIFIETNFLNNKRNDTFGNISTKHLNKVSDIFTPPLYITSGKN